MHATSGLDSYIDVASSVVGLSTDSSYINTILVTFHWC